MESFSRTRKAAAVITFFLGLFLLVSVLSFDPADPPSHAVYPPNSPPANWCGRAGAHVAFGLLLAVGDGAYPLLLFLLAGAFLWISKIRLEDKIFRVVGAAMLIVAVTVASAMLKAPARLPESNGGILGLAAWQFIEPRLGAFGAVLLLIPVVLVGLVLLTDTWFILLPLIIIRWVRDRAAKPCRRLAGATLSGLGAAGSRLRTAASTSEPSEDAEEDDQPLVRKQHRPKSDSAESEEPAAPPAAPLAPPRPIVVRHIRPATPSAEETSEEFAFTPLASTPRNQEYQLPPVDLLSNTEYAAESEDHESVVREKAEVLIGTLAEFGVQASVIAIETGPVVTQYEVALAPGIKVGKVIGLSDDIAIALKAPSVRIVAPLPGKDTIGVEVPNTSRQIVTLKEIVLAAREAPQRMGLPLFLGKDATGDPLVKDLAVMPHLLIAGTTGSGKSVCLNTTIVSLLLTRTPDDLKLVLIDPKMVELSVFKRLPHLLCPVVNDMRKAEAILGWLVEQMDERYRVLSQAGVRNIASYNRLSRDELIQRFQPQTPEQEAKIPLHLPHICVIVDELADLMMVAAKEVESHVTRLSQKSRAVGIHLVMATQRPSVDV
ncbi:MAG TPA: DNA translocase FtsK 4TM domain-containing protein, partial [Phycisphaerae bacterium]|nr:DNA translocase FtsK 4TM domain-containing protein [Phycisphaerae bacterium]